MAVQVFRTVSFIAWFLFAAFFVHGVQILGFPLYILDRRWFYAVMALTKSYFGLIAITLTSWWSPTTIRISGDKSMAGLITQEPDGTLRMELGERIVLMTNHQLYTDWLYLWWVGYTNVPAAHGHIYIILKQSLQYIPMMGPGMKLFGFIFMARKWATDQARMSYRLRKLSIRHPTGSLTGSNNTELDPMWLIIFPEGTNLSANTRAQSARFSAKSGIPDLKHQILPRSTGLQFCLNELGDTVEYLYDCTIGYEGIPPGGYGQDIFTLRSVMIQGRVPKSVNMHWRRFPIHTLPLQDHDAMYAWLQQRWREKDDLLEAFQREGKFPADVEAVHIEGGPQEKEWKTAYINTSVKTKRPWEFLQMFAPVTAVWLVARILIQALDLAASFSAKNK